MVFNWFRRQFNDEEKQQEQSSETPVGTVETTDADAADAEQADPSEEGAAESDGDGSGPSNRSENSDSSEDEDEPEISLDNLAWAKAAYQSVQKQEEANAEPEPEEPQLEEAKVETSGSEVAIASESATESATDPATVIEPEPETTEPEEPPEETTVAAEEQPSTEAVEAVEEAVEEVEATVEPETEAIAAVEDVEAVAEALPAEEVEEAEEEPAAAPISFLERAEAEREERLERVKAEAIAPEEPEIDEEDEVPPPEPIIEFDENFLWSAEVLAAQGRRPEEVSIEEISWLNQLRQGLDKTRQGLVNDLKIVFGQGPLNEDAVEEIEALLLQADVGVTATDLIIEALQEKLRDETLPPEAAIAYLKKILRDLLDEPARKPGDDPTVIPMLVPEKDQLNIWLMTGVNGAGKTTTIGKLARLATKSDYRCLIAAADTFRAAAVEQVQEWGRRSDVEVIANPGQNTDPAAVVFDAISAAQSRNTELLLVDTAGRLQNKKNLMEELSKMRRIVDKKAPGTNVESLLVLDSTLGQNGLQQAKLFAEAAQLSGVVLTKLDGSAKGGVAIAVAQQLKLPIRFIGAGEKVEDLRPFSSYEFVEALLNG